jgi:hypothetical protein
MSATSSDRWKAAAKFRWLVVTATIVLTVGTTLAILGTTLWGWHFGLGHGDLPSRINTVVAVCAFILVAATLFVALIAYLAATGRPDLEPQLHFPNSDVNRPVLRAAPSQRQIERSPQSVGNVVLVNRSRYSARNPGIRIELDGLGGLAPQPGWTGIASENDTGTVAIQWDGGADYLIHGNWSRVLPNLDFGFVSESKSDRPPQLVVTVAADGLKPTAHRVPVTILDSREYAAYQAKRNGQLVAVPPGT